MRLLKRLRFAFTYNFEPEFIVVPFGEPYDVVRFLKYEDALTFAKKCAKERPQFLQPEILMIIRKARHPNN